MKTFLAFNLAQVERVGFTRNASQTPYIVYITVSGRRCCTFVKRRLFYELLRLLLGITQKIDAILSAKVTEWGGLTVKTQNNQYAIARTNVCAFFLHYHTAAFNQLTAELNEIGATVAEENHTYQVNLVRCNCTILHDCCPHRIATGIQLLNRGWASVAEYMRSLSQPQTDGGQAPATGYRNLTEYTLSARSRSAISPSPHYPACCINLY